MCEFPVNVMQTVDLIVRELALLFIKFRSVQLVSSASLSLEKHPKHSNDLKPDESKEHKKISQG